MKPRYQIAVILINYNTSSYTLACTRSIQERTNPNLAYQIIVVDNASREEEFAQLEGLRNEPRLTLVRSRINGGFSLGNMLGVQEANADYYLFLNNDTLLRNDCLQIWYDFMQKNTQTAVCSGQMFDGDGKKHVNFGYLPRLSLNILGSGFMRLFLPDSFPKRHTDYTEPIAVEVLNGSALFVRASTFDDIGGFDINHFLYCEEEDLAFKVKKRGELVYLVPQAEYTHFISQSTQDQNNLRLAFLKEFYISYLYYFRKHKGKLKTVLSQGFLFLRYASKAFKNIGYLRLAWFILTSAHLHNSLRFKQKVGKYL